MPYRSLEVRVRKEFVPSETHAIAARLRAVAAAQAEDTAARVESITVTVGQSEIQKVWVDEARRPSPMAD